MTEFTVAGASLETEEPLPPLEERGFEHARSFQNRVVEWIHEGNSPVAALRAPTGAGKTATFFELIESRDMTLLVYPTNALLRQQRERFEAEEIEVSVLTGETLDGHGHLRTENLLRHVNPYAADHDVVLTNPDILQAAVQALYKGGDVMRLFNLFDAIVYDEYHFYDAHASSGILLQIKLLSERQSDPKILLASATPNEDFVAFLDKQVGLDVRGIEASFDSDGDQFRHAVDVVRRGDETIIDERESIASALLDRIESSGEYSEPHAAVIFNSAKESNDFHDFLHREYPTVFQHTVKDNGFDTDDDAVDPDGEDFFVLNTTSKGEVGLDYDIRSMFMEAPFAPSDFLQRFGRAGRQSEATVHVFGLGKGPWGGDVGFQTFARQIYDGMEADRMDQSLLADLVGFRAALAIADREEQTTWFNPELRDDFRQNVARYNRWRRFVANVERECAEIKDGFGPGKYQSNSPEAKLLRFTRHCFDAFRGLRGKSLPASIEYPRGDRTGVTTYDLTSTLRNYDIDRVKANNVIVVAPSKGDIASTVTARLPAYESEPTKYDRATCRIEDQLQTKIHREINRVELTDEFEVDTGLLHRFFRMIRIVDSVVPSRLTTAEYELTVDDSSSGPPALEVTQRAR